MGFFTDMTDDDFDEDKKSVAIKPITPAKPQEKEEEPASSFPMPDEIAASEEEIPADDYDEDEAYDEEPAPEPPAEPTSAPVPVAAKSDGAQPLIIPKGISLDGSVSGEVDIIVSGEVKGGVSTTGKVQILGGTVGGEIEGTKGVVISENSKVTSSVRGGVNITVQKGSLVDGDITCDGEVSVAGDVRGNIVSNAISLSASSRVKGDIRCAKLQISRGALFAGSITQEGAENW